MSTQIDHGNHIKAPDLKDVLGLLYTSTAKRQLSLALSKKFLILSSYSPIHHLFNTF